MTTASNRAVTRDDISTGHGFHTYRHVERWGPSPPARAELLDRLLLTNNARAVDTAGDTGNGAPLPTASEEGTLFA